MRCGLLFALVLVGAACGADGGDDGTTDGESTGSSGASGSASGSPTSASESSAMSQSASADSSAGTSADGSDTGSGGATDGSSGNASNAESSDGGTPQTHHLMNGDQSVCDDPLWCYYNGNVDVPAGDPIEGQECFIAPVAPPFELIEMHYVVASTHTELESFELRIYSRDGGAPLELIESIAATSVEAAPLEHYYAFDPPIVIDTMEFCVGFGAFEPGVASSIGMAIDTDGAIGGVSYVRMEGAGACNIPAWEDATMHEPAPAGNWCMDATIREIP